MQDFTWVLLMILIFSIGSYQPQEQNENLVVSPAQYNSVVNITVSQHTPLRARRYPNKYSKCSVSSAAPVVDSDNNIVSTNLLKPRPLRVSK